MWYIDDDSASYGDVFDIDRLGERHWQVSVGLITIQSSRLTLALVGLSLHVAPCDLTPPQDTSTRLGKALAAWVRSGGA
jgi:hypothetical protein